MKIIGNFGFLNRLIYLIQVTESGNVKNEDLKVYRRIFNRETITLIPGPSGGLYPTCKDQIRELSDFGVGVVFPGYLGWKRGLRNTDKAIAEVQEWSNDVQENSLQDDIDQLTAKMLKITINTKEYKPAHKTLSMDTEYTIVAFGREMFRGRECIFARMTDGSML
ncbi:hypothetical protein BGX20_001364 [Mortierella sp. AD010]|nr:hypothetical protein BGX20_001364 [Mortierella sp. AD010]